jgi:hypothetical protein
MRRLGLIAVALALAAGCAKRDPLRELVEKDTTGSAAAMAVCARPEGTPPPVEACKRVGARGADNVLAMAKPNEVQCADAMELAERFAPEKLTALAAKCCYIENGLDSASEAICKRLKPPRPAVPWANDREWGFIHGPIKGRLDSGEEIPPDGVKMAREICARRAKEGKPIPDCANVISRLPQ